MKKVLAMALALAFVMATGLSAKDGDLKASVSGNVDASYGINNNMQSNGLAIDEARVIVKGSADGMSGLVEGKLANLVTATAGANSLGIGVTPAADVLGISQAYLMESMLDSMITVKLGKFYNPTRLEAVDVSDRDNVSPYLLATLGQEISTFTGAELVVATGEMFKVGAVVSNSAYPAGNQAKDLGGFVALAPMKELKIKAGYLYQPLYVPSAITGLPIFDSMQSIVANVKWDVMDSLSVGGEYLYSTLLANGAKDASGALESPLQMMDPSTGKMIVFSPKQQGYSLMAKCATPLWDIVAVPRFSAFYRPDPIPTLVALPVPHLVPNPVQADFEYTLTLKKTDGALTTYLEIRSDASNLAQYSQGDGKDLVYSSVGVNLGANYAF